MMFVGGSALDKFWVVGQNPFGIMPGNFAICSNYISGNPTGNVQSNVGLQINQDGAVFIPNTLNSWTVYINQNAYINTLQVNQYSYLNGSVLLNSVDINTLCQTRAWVSLKVSYNALNQTPITVYQYGRATATLSTAN